MQRGQPRFLRAETPFIFKSARLDPGWPNFDALPHRGSVLQRMHSLATLAPALSQEREKCKRERRRFGAVRGS